MIARLAWAGVAVAILAILASLGLATAQLVKHRAGVTTVTPFGLPDLPSRSSETTPTDLTAITDLAPFGRAVQTNAREEASSATQMPSVALRGVLLDPDLTQSRAFLHVGSAVGVYKIGDDVASGELIRIDRETVTLRSEGADFVVGFDGVIGAEDDPPAPAAASSETGGSDPFARLAAAIVAGQGSIDLRAAPPPETTEEYIDLWRERIVRNPQEAMDRVGVELVENGYRVKPDPNIGVTLAGLRPGDVITGLNGQSVGNLEQDRILYDEVAAAGIARVEVERDGQALLLTFPLR